MTSLPASLSIFLSICPPHSPDRRLGPLGVRLLREYLMVSCALRSLVIRMSELGTEGCAELVRILEEETHQLEELVIDDSTIREEGFASIAKCLWKTSSLRSVELGGSLPFTPPLLLRLAFVS